MSDHTVADAGLPERGEASLPLIPQARKALRDAEQAEMGLSLKHQPRRQAIAREVQEIRRHIDRLRASFGTAATGAAMLEVGRQLDELAARQQALIDEGQAMQQAREAASARTFAARGALATLEAEAVALRMDVEPGQRARWSGEALAAKLRRLAALVGDGLPEAPGLDVETYLAGIAERDEAAEHRARRPALTSSLGDE